MLVLQCVSKTTKRYSLVGAMGSLETCPCVSAVALAQYSHRKGASENACEGLFWGCRLRWRSPNSHSPAIILYQGFLHCMWGEIVSRRMSKHALTRYSLTGWDKTVASSPCHPSFPTMMVDFPLTLSDHKPFCFWVGFVMVFCHSNKKRIKAALGGTVEPWSLTLCFLTDQEVRIFFSLPCCLSLN